MSRDHKQWTGFYMIKASVMKELRISVQIYMNIIYSNMNIILIALQTTHSLVKTKAVYFLNSQSFLFLRDTLYSILILKAYASLSFLGKLCELRATLLCANLVKIHFWV